MTPDDDLLRRAHSAIVNLKAVATRQARYNQRTREGVEATIRALAARMENPDPPGCFVVVERCDGYVCSCRGCGWKQHHRNKFSARDDGNEHEASAP